MATSSLGKPIILDKEGARRLKEIANKPLDKYVEKIPAQRIPSMRYKVDYEKGYW